MLRNYYINKEWMVSDTARRIYRAAARLSWGLFFVPVALAIAKPHSVTVLSLMKVLLLLSALCSATTFTAMEYFMFGFDKSSAWKKLFWFCFMLVPVLGPSLYCFRVYSRSELFATANPQRAEGVSA